MDMMKFRAIKLILPFGFLPLFIVIVLVLLIGGGTDTAIAGTLHQGSTPPRPITITQPADGTVITSTHLPTYVVQGEYDCSPLGEGGTLELGQVYLSLDGGSTWLWVHTGGWKGSWVYTWNLPIADVVTKHLWARLMCVGQGWTTGIITYSHPVTVTVDTKGPEAYPPSPHRSPWVASTITYTWPPAADNSGVDFYRIQITNARGYNFETEASSPFRFTNALSENVEYYARVKAWDKKGNPGDWSEQSVSVKPDLTPPHNVVITAPRHVSATAFYVLWGADDELSGVDKYDVKWRKGGEPAWRGWLTGTHSTYGLFTQVESGENTYEFAVWAYDLVGNRSISKTAQTYVGPFRGDISIASPAAGKVITTAYGASLRITGRYTGTYLEDSGGGYCRVDISTDGGQSWRLGIYSGGVKGSWEYTWPIPASDNISYTLMAGLTCINVHGGIAGMTESDPVTIWVDNVAPQIAEPPTPHRSPWITSTVIYTWPQATDNSGIAAYHIRITNTLGYVTERAATSPFAFTEALSEGVEYYAALKAWDGVGNESGWSSLSTAVIPDLTPPLTPVITVPSHISATQFMVRWGACDALSGVDKYNVWYREQDGSWQEWQMGTTSTEALFTGAKSRKTYKFKAVAYDGVGWASPEGTARVYVGPFYVYLPALLKNYPPLVTPVVNGSFERDWEGWTVEQERLPAWLVSEGRDGLVPAEGSQMALLGRKGPNEDYDCDKVPYPAVARLKQRIQVPDVEGDVTLVFRYVIFTQDGKAHLGQYDSFDVLINGTLVGRYGNTSSSQACAWFRVPSNGWGEGRISLNEYKGQEVEIAFENWTRYDNWYNTYTYLDDVYVECSLCVK